MTDRDRAAPGPEDDDPLDDDLTVGADDEVLARIRADLAAGRDPQGGATAGTADPDDAPVDDLADDETIAAPPGLWSAGQEPGPSAPGAPPPVPGARPPVPVSPPPVPGAPPPAPAPPPSPSGPAPSARDAVPPVPDATPPPAGGAWAPPARARREAPGTPTAPSPDSATSGGTGRPVWLVPVSAAVVVAVMVAGVVLLW